MLAFSRSEQFHEDILIGSLSSIPRWTYARTIEERECECSFQRTNKALEALLESSRKIITGRNPVFEHFPNREDNGERIRLSLSLYIYYALMRTALYLNEKNEFGIRLVLFPLLPRSICTTSIPYAVWPHSELNYVNTNPLSHTQSLCGGSRVGASLRGKQSMPAVSTHVAQHPAWK